MSYGRSMAVYGAKQPNVNAMILQCILRSSGGVVTVSDLCKLNFFTNLHTAKTFLQQNPQHFRLEGIKGVNCKVYAQTRAEICDEYEPRIDDCRVPGCDKFHLCKHFVTGSCKFGQRCKSSHQLHSAHNQQVLESHQLDVLDDDIILQLLKLSCVECTVPDVCSFYNTRGCKNETTCTFLHVCIHYIKGDCTFADRCRRSHNILDQQPRMILQKFGIDVKQDPKDLVRIVRLKKRREGDDDDDEDGENLDLASVTLDPDPTAKVRRIRGKSSSQVQRQSSAKMTNDQPYICIFHLGGKCNYDEKCFNLHTEEPFQWQWHKTMDDNWEQFAPCHNLEIEKTFCNPNKNTTSVSFRSSTGKIVTTNVDINTHRMTYNTGTTQVEREIRRLGPRFESQGWRSAFATTWLWYWKDDNAKYVEYGKQSTRGTEATINSKSLEEAYSSFVSGDHVGRLHFQSGQHRYEIDFENMKQENQLLVTKRKVKRRPQFASKTDVNGRVERYKTESTALTTVPDAWDKDVVSHTDDFQLCSVSKTSNEFRDVSRRFLATMPSATIVSIKRVQNVELWEEFTRKQKKMEKKNGGTSIREEVLFHGTTEHVLYAICQQNFDHRLSGTRVGAKYGQGAYFHKSAKYSDGFAKTDAKGYKRMFVARVLVGSFTRGSKDLRRPPPKDPRRPYEDFFDTCADDRVNPSIFVTFENNQVYPEYIIAYR